jgi:hypothetical protein
MPPNKFNLMRRIKHVNKVDHVFKQSECRIWVCPWRWETLTNRRLKLVSKTEKIWLAATQDV